MNCGTINQNWKFELECNNEGEMTVSDPLINTEERARERADSEFLKNSYSSNSITFSTYLDDINQNDVINIGGLPFLVKNITVGIDSKKEVFNITAVRYDL